MGSVTPLAILGPAKNTGNACWKQVVKVVADHPFIYLEKIAATLILNYSRLNSNVSSIQDHA